ncbi:MAG: polysaccharide deacetylase family protein [Candidatus Margulisbacteria bacterium]|nr:polysaccharide deacetylase family protein [Candidatus Margulisiibacteriota bacterium]MBU1022135.1 polysaccharide deacetylase family protein [Candidatus Margulisiibacteriota bacterium]MBU1729426.1 polysaccharide deacetylase family protein [Candidatus Margulisiibacteriota bacterium]MBU1955699.1 polysaccharide deacetylase family protein [Candidatus Margulisiibacteriota bacterium]
MRNKIITVTFIIIITASIAYAQVMYQALPSNKVALTFDDGPSKGYTERVLDILQKENAKATFFVLGLKVAMNPDILKRMYEEGHEIGSHTYYHTDLDAMDNEEFESELKTTTELIEDITGKKDELFRPPHGRLTYEKRKILEEKGYDIVMWSVHADDFSYPNGWVRSSEAIAERVINSVHGGDIVLMHDRTNQLVEALPQIVKELKAKGYKFVTISELVNRKSAQSFKGCETKKDSPSD